MLKKEQQLLEEAYLSVSRPAKLKPAIPSDEEAVTTEPNSEVNVGPMDEPAPGVDIQMAEPQNTPSTEEPVQMSSTLDPDSRMSTEDEDEEDSMALDNLNSIRESIMKIATFCGSGNHLEPWMQQKLAIAMDNLAGVARALRC